MTQPTIFSFLSLSYLYLYTLNYGYCYSSQPARQTASQPDYTTATATLPLVWSNPFFLVLVSELFSNCKYPRRKKDGGKKGKVACYVDRYIHTLYRYLSPFPLPRFYVVAVVFMYPRGGRAYDVDILIALALARL
ncbi:hypothetical protein GGR53DRAFT_124778 [Hypoxylon sp. FL1150]|nr:hypothetical protein GGR53DRAFT_124778 [Hypoxylon sp. FL1150]